MSIGCDFAVGRVDTREVLVIALARFEDPVLGVIGCIVGTTDTVVNVLAELGGVRAGRVAGLEAELVAAHET